MNTWKVLAGDVRAVLQKLPSHTVQTVVTSPPYWGLRDYGMTDQIGLESSPAEYVDALVETFRGVRRVLRDDGTVWLNLGDTYASTSIQNTNGLSSKSTLNPGVPIPNVRKAVGTFKRPALTYDVKIKDLVGIPWRVAFALQNDGWYLRSDIIWSKPNPMPESVTDRPTKSHEYIFLLSKQADYFYDQNAIRDQAMGVERSMSFGKPKERNDNDRVFEVDGLLGRNKPSVWTIGTRMFIGEHFASYPEKLIEPCVLAGSRVGDVVLDPFCGSGTTGVVSVSLQRNFIGCELNPEYAEMSRRRIRESAPLFATEIGDVDLSAANFFEGEP